MTDTDYVHGYSPKEATRLVDQAQTLVELLHHDTAYPPGNLVLEAGCGVGAQTVTLAKNSPRARITSIDISPDSLTQAKRRVEAAGFSHVTFMPADVFNLPFAPASFDHVFVCFVLEHLADPLTAVRKLLGVLKPGGTLTVIEGDHGSAFFHPDSAHALRAIQCLVDLQAQNGGNALIGRELYPLLTRAGVKNVRVSPRMVYADASRPQMVDGFTKKTFTAMVEGARDGALAAGLVDETTWDQGIADLYRTAQDDGTFSYTFFKAVGGK
ncbi:MAG: methyltransferase domain-containing protein [Phycisphaeraceae bacterium]|nr:methyltransferase domain-containing protein [Phycisphaeraceae bacterium]